MLWGSAVHKDKFKLLKSMMQRQLEAENQSIGFIYQEQNMSGIRKVESHSKIPSPKPAEDL